MKLEVLVPSEVLLERDDVLRIVAETRAGSFGLLPLRRDCVAALTAGILTFETAAEGEVFVAVDEGVLVKTGAEVRVSVRRAIVGTDLAELRTQVEHEFKDIDQHERNIRSVMAKLESGFLHRLAGLRNDR